MDFEYSIYTSAGVRLQNEDSAFPEPGSGQGGKVFIVADGLGGQADGNVASNLACSSLSEILINENPASYVIGGHRLSTDQLLKAFLSDAVRQAAAVVWDEANRRQTDMATTILAVFCSGEQMAVAHVGDTALFLAQPGSSKTACLTQVHRQGSLLNRTLGGQEQVTPDVQVITPGEDFALALGSDGFWEYVEPSRMLEILESYPPFVVAQILAEEAAQAGSQDNITVIALQSRAWVERNIGLQTARYESFSARPVDWQAFCQRYPDLPETARVARLLTRAGSSVAGQPDAVAPHLSDLEEQVARLESQTIALRRQIGDLQTDLIAARAESGDQQRAADASQAQIQSLQVQLNKAQVDLQWHKTLMRKLASTLEALERRYPGEVAALKAGYLDDLYKWTVYDRRDARAGAQRKTGNP